MHHPDDAVASDAGTLAARFISGSRGRCRTEVSGATGRNSTTSAVILSSARRVCSAAATSASAAMVLLQWGQGAREGGGGGPRVSAADGRGSAGVLGLELPNFGRTHRRRALEGPRAPVAQPPAVRAAATARLTRARRTRPRFAAGGSAARVRRSAQPACGRCGGRGRQTRASTPRSQRAFRPRLNRPHRARARARARLDCRRLRSGRGRWSARPPRRRGRGRRGSHQATPGAASRHAAVLSAPSRRTGRCCLRHIARCCSPRRPRTAHWSSGRLPGERPAPAAPREGRPRSRRRMFGARRLAPRRARARPAR